MAGVLIQKPWASSRPARLANVDQKPGFPSDSCIDGPGQSCAISFYGSRVAGSTKVACNFLMHHWRAKLSSCSLMGQGEISIGS